MTLTAPYRQHNYMGEYADDAACLTFIQANKWDSSADGLGTPQNGMIYYNTTSHVFKVRANGAWTTLSQGTLDHGALSGLADDDHSQYLLANGTRALTGDMSMGGNQLTNVGSPILGTDAANKDYVDAVAQGIDWQDSVLDRFDPTSALPVGPNQGDRYIATATANGWTIHNIYEYEGSTWEETVPNEGFAAWVEDENIVYVFNGTSWVKMATIFAHNDLASLQGGTTNEYYHLTSAQHGGLTGGTDTTLHTHDGRYYTETELGSTTASSEGASLIGTDTKVALNNATTVEVALTYLAGQNPAKRASGAGTPVSTVSGVVGDLYVDTTNDFVYINIDGTTAGWTLV
jgi:hypothetical protein